MFFKSKEKFPSGYDYIVVGLGNPGTEYENTRHNLGFQAMDVLCKKFGVECKKLKFKSLICDANIEGKRCLLMKPQTFMNLSGQAVSEAMQFYKVQPENVIVMFDDVSLDVGRLRVRPKGSDGGHNGMKNIIYLSGKDTFPRVKIGAGQKPHPDYDLAKWVLSRFAPDDIPKIKEVISLAADAAVCIIKSDVQTAMNSFNR